MSASNRTQLFRILFRYLPFVAVVAALGHEGAHGQQNNITRYNQVLGQWDASQAARTNVNRGGTGSPNGRDQCNRVGESYFQTDAAAGQNVWYCTSLPSTWTNAAGVPSAASLPATCTVGQLFFDTTAGASFGLNQCAATNSWSEIGGGGITYQGSVTAGAPVVAVSPNKIQSLTASTTCTTGFTGLYPATCATVVLTGQNAQVEVDNVVVPCGGSICPAGLYRVNLYEWITTGNCGPSDVNIGWADTSQAQNYDLTGGAYQTASASGVGAYVGSVAFLYSTGVQNITYTLLPGSVVLAATTTLTSIYITLERLE